MAGRELEKQHAHKEGQESTGRGKALRDEAEVAAELDDTAKHKRLEHHAPRREKQPDDKYTERQRTIATQ